MAYRQAAPTSTAKTPAGSDREASNSDHSDMAIYIGLPLIIVVFLAIIVLLLLFIYFMIRAKNRSPYRKVPKEGRLTNLSTLPYPSIKPPEIKIENVPAPDMSFTVAPQLPTPASMQRYPFIKQKRPQQNKPVQHYDGSPEKRSKKKYSDHRRTASENGSQTGRRDSGTHSASPPSPDRSASGTGSVVSLSQFGEQHSGISDAFMISAGKKQVGRTSSSADKLPEIFLGLTYLRGKTILVVNVERVVGLPPREDGAEVDAYVRLFFIPKLPEMAQRKTSKTRTAKKELDPVFHEQIQYEAMSEEELVNSTLHVQVLDYRTYGRHHIIGQSELSLGHVTLGEDTESVVLQLHAPKTSVSYGTVLLSMCYNPDSKKLSVILLRAKDLNKENDKETDPQAKLQVTIGDKVVGRLRTKRKSESCSPIFNEALTCTVDPSNVQKLVITVTVMNEHKSVSKRELGSLTLSSQCSGEEFRHWNDVLAQPGKHIAEWHELRQR